MRLVESGQSIAEAARSLGVVEQTLSNWVKAKRSSLRSTSREWPSPADRRTTPARLSPATCCSPWVLLAMGLDKNRARTSMRFSLLKTATDADVDYVLSAVPEAVERLRAVSPVEAGTLG